MDAAMAMREFKQQRIPHKYTVPIKQWSDHIIRLGGLGKRWCLGRGEVCRIT